MGRWTFEGGNPLYIPDEGEGGGGMLGHLGSGIAQTLSGGVQAAGDALGAVAQAPGIRQGLTALGAPARAVVATGHALAPGGYKGTTDPIDYIMTGEKDDPEDLAGYGDLLADVMEAEGTINEQGLTAKAIRDVGNAIQDPLILFGAARGVAKMAGGGRPVPPSSATRVARSPGGAPPPGAVARQTHGGAPGAWTPGTPGTPGGPNTVIRGSLRDADKKVMRGMREIAEDAPGGGGRAPWLASEEGMLEGTLANLPHLTDDALNGVITRTRPGAVRDLLLREQASRAAGLSRGAGGQGIAGEIGPGGSPRGPGGGGVAGGPGSPRQPRARYRHPPVDPEDAARFPSAPLDTDLASPGAFTTGGTKGMPTGRPPKGAKARRVAERHGRAREMGRQEQLQEGVGKMKGEQLEAGRKATVREELQKRARDLGDDPTTGREGPARIAPANQADVKAQTLAQMRGQGPGPMPPPEPMAMPMPRDALRAMIQAAVEHGASADDVMKLISNLGG